MTTASVPAAGFDTSVVAGRSWLLAGLGAVGIVWGLVVVGLFVTRGLEAWVPDVPPRPLALEYADPACAWSWHEARRVDPADPWSYHGQDDGRRGRCVSRPFELGPEPTLAVRYGGDSADPRVSVSLEAVGEPAATWRLELPARALHVWMTAFVLVPDAARGRSVRLVVADDSGGARGFVAVRALAAVGKEMRAHGGLLLPPRLVVAVAALLLALGWLVAPSRRLVSVALVAAGVLTVFLQATTFYHRDDWGLVHRLSLGPPPGYFIGYYQQFEPVVITVYAGLVAALRAAYAPQQLLIVLAHVGVVLLLARLLRRHGLDPALSLAVALVYAVVWTHADVVPWFLELFYVASTGFTLVALDAAAGWVAGERRGLPPLVGACVLATLCFIGGVVAFPLTGAYVLAFGGRGRGRAVVALATALVVTTVVAVIAMPLGGAVSDSTTGLERLQAMAVYLGWGIAEGSVVPFVGFGRLGLGRALAAVVGLASAVVLLLPSTSARLRRGIGFGLVWLVGTYALQAVVRWQQGAFQATSFRYSYFGMTAVAFVVACLLDAGLGRARRAGRLVRWLEPPAPGLGARAWLPPPARLLAAALLAAVVAVHVATYLRRIDAHEREYYALSRMHYELTAAQLRLARRGEAAAPAGRVPASLATALDWETYVGVAAWLGRIAPATTLPGTAAGWNPYLE